MRNNLSMWSVPILPLNCTEALSFLRDIGQCREVRPTDEWFEVLVYFFGNKLLQFQDVSSTTLSHVVGIRRLSFYISIASGRLLSSTDGDGFWLEKVRRILHMPDCSRSLSTIRLTISATDTPSLLAASFRKTICGFVNTMDRCVVFIRTRLAMDWAVVKGVYYAF